MIANQILTHLLCAAALTSGALAVTIQSQPLAERVAAFELELATGVPGEALRTTLRGLEQACQEAVALQPDAEQPRALKAQLASLRSEIEGKVKGGQAGTQDSPAEVTMGVAVKAAVDAGDGNFLSRMGERAVPALRELARHPSDLLRRDEADPALKWLMVLDPRVAADVALELMASKNYAVKRETLRYVERIFNRRELYRFDPERGIAIRNPDWRRIPDLALEEPGIPRDDVITMYIDLARKGALPEGREGVLISASSFPGDIDAEVVLENPSLWRKMMRVEPAGVRKSAVESMAKIGRFGETLWLANDPSAEVRQTVAERLGMVTVKTVKATPEGVDVTWTSVPQAASPELLAAFTRLTCEEDDVDVMKAAWASMGDRAIMNGDLPLTAAELRAILPRVPDVGMLWWFVGTIQGLPEGERLPMALSVVQELGRREFSTTDGPPSVVSRLLAPENWGGTPAEDFWPVASALRGIDGMEPFGHRIIFTSAQGLFRDGKIPANGFADWLVADRDSMGVSLPWYRRGSNESFVKEWILAMDEPSRARMLEARGRFFLDDGELARRFSAVPSTGAQIRGPRLFQDPAVLRGICVNGEAVPETRLWAAQQLDRGAWDENGRELVAAVADAVAAVEQPWRANEALDHGQMKPWKNRVIAELVGRQEVDDGFLLQFKAVGGGEGLVDAVLKRFPLSSWNGLGEDQRLMTSILPNLIHGIERGERQPLTVDSLATRRLRSTAAEELRPFRSDRNFQLLTEILARTEDRNQYEVLLSIGRYLDDRAAGVLLNAAKATNDPSMRDVAMEQVAKISAWREAAAVWEKSVSAEARRGKALDGLVAILGDKAATLEARVAAMKGLGVLQAAEELPRIIAALSSKEPALQEAARAAIERIE